LKDTAKTKKQLVAELEELRQQRAVKQAAERLREHVLAMRTSEDLYSVGTAFLVEVRHLGIDTLFLGILLFEGEKIVHHYPVTVSYVHMGLKLRNENDPAIKKVTNEAVIRDIPPDQMPEPWKVEAYRAFQTKSVTKVRNYLDDSWLRNDWTGTESNLNRAIDHWTGEWIRIHIPFSQGAIGFNSRTDDEQQVKTVAFLAEVFSLGYTRFLDLQQLENQNRELEQANIQIQEATQRKSQFLRRELDDVGEIRTDPDRLRQVVMNLLGNATKFTGEGSITLSLRRVGGAAELSVADTGIGIPAEDLLHIFDEFRQVERQGGEQTEGTGLGLAIAKKTVELLGGTISAESEVGKGTTFTLRITNYEAQ